MAWLAVAHLAATSAMLGVVWFVDLVHYPLFSRADREGFPQFAAQHQRRTGWVVIPLMLAEAACAVALAVAAGLGHLPTSWPAWLGLGLLAGIWAMTGAALVPLHLRLLEGYDDATHRRLAGVNRWRAAAWSARAGLAAWMAAQGIG